MKHVLLYWCLGCLVVGPAFGSRIDQCPTEKTDFIQMTAAVAIWPAILMAAFMLKPGLPKTACENRAAE